MDDKAILAKWAAQEWTERHKEKEEEMLAIIKEAMEEQKKEAEKKAKKYKVKN